MIMEFTQMECGCTCNVFKQSYKQYASAITDENWVTSIWAHLEWCEATVKITGLWKPKYGRENDNAIMETITASGMFRPVEIQEINKCRLYLQAFFTSDIADNRGKTLEYPQEHMGMAGTAKTNIMEGMETSDHGAVHTGRQHAANPGCHKSGMVPGHEGTGTMAPNKIQMDKTPRTEHQTAALCHSRHGGSRTT
jgi:hypothetical protein